MHMNTKIRKTAYSNIVCIIQKLETTQLFSPVQSLNKLVYLHNGYFIAVLKLWQFCLPGDIWRFLQTFSIITMQEEKEECATGI